MTAATEATNFSTTLLNNVPILLAVIGIVGGIIAAKVIKPPAYQELVTENANLRKERREDDDKYDLLRKDFEQFRQERDQEKRKEARRRGLLADGIDAMWSYIQVLIADMERYGNPVPQPSDYVRTTMESARAAREGDKEGTNT